MSKAYGGAQALLVLKAGTAIVWVAESGWQLVYFGNMRDRVGKSSNVRGNASDFIAFYFRD